MLRAMSMSMDAMEETQRRGVVVYICDVCGTIKFHKKKLNKPKC
jgi:RNase P/RNase MRP subunit POP5